MKIISDCNLRQKRTQSRTVAGANVNFHIAVVLACLLNIRISFMYTSSCICLGNKLQLDKIFI